MRVGDEDDKLNVELDLCGEELKRGQTSFRNKKQTGPGRESVETEKVEQERMKVMSRMKQRRKKLTPKWTWEKEMI